MPGTFTPRALADGFVSTTRTAIYTCPAATWVYVKSLTLFNDNAATQTIVIFINHTGTARKIRRYVLAQDEHANGVDPGEMILLEAGDSIELQTTTASAVPFVLMGVTET